MHKVASNTVPKEHFIRECERNFSVIAPAGVGKTYAIVERIIHFAFHHRENAKENLPKLIVVTYTNKAAEEMQQRAKIRLLEKGASFELIQAFDEVFFGTIHSFCLKLISDFGFHAGLPSHFTVKKNNEEFSFQDLKSIFEGKFGLYQSLLRYVEWNEIFKLSKKIKKSACIPKIEAEPPIINLDPIFEVKKTKVTEENILYYQNLALEWQEREKSLEVCNPIPFAVAGGSAFIEIWNACFKPLIVWIHSKSLEMAHELSHLILNADIEQQQLSYDDQIYLAFELLNSSSAAHAIRRKNLRIILDEAQDTDSDQFEVLIQCSREIDAKLEWRKEAQLRPGALSIIGDPQQLIYGSRADLKFYNLVRETILKNNGEEVFFNITHRCSKNITSFVNQKVNTLLDGKFDQAKYVPLESFTELPNGQVQVLKGDWGVELEKVNSAKKREALWLAQKVKELGLDGFKTTHWSQVAILCYKKDFCTALAFEFEKQGISYQMQSSELTRIDNPLFRWVLAMCIILTEPENHFEIFGILHEIFGFSDEEIYYYCKGNGEKLQIKQKNEENIPVGIILNKLVEIRNIINGVQIREALEEIIESIALISKLNSLEELKCDWSLRDLEELFLLADESELENLSFVEFTKKLIELKDQPTQSNLIQPECIQLITYHKSKGLEWDVVILPFLYHELSKKYEYPIIIRQNNSEQPDYILNKYCASVFSEKTDNNQVRYEQELQRLLYVGLTRAKKNLILIDDHDIFHGNRSFGKWLQLDQLQGINPFPPETSENFLQNSEKDEILQSGFQVDFEKARISSEQIKRKKVPHETAKKILDYESEIRSSLGVNRAKRIDYGLWWHELCQKMPWEKNIKEWNDFFLTNLVYSPNTDRSTHDWSLFLKSEIVDFFESSYWEVLTETPFIYELNSDEIVEGVVDLILYHKESKQCCIIDWKTDEITENVENAIKKYSQQISLYKLAIEKMSHFTCLSYIYSTYQGKLFLIE
jgi:ATP-dependent helicase/nuclease subunit A